MEELTLEEVKKRTGLSSIVSYKYTGDGYIELTDSDGDKTLYTKDWNASTDWYLFRRYTKEGLIEIRTFDNFRMLYSAGDLRELTARFKGDYIITDGVIYEKREVGRVDE